MDLRETIRILLIEIRILLIMARILLLEIRIFLSIIMMPPFFFCSTNFADFADFADKSSCFSEPHPRFYPRYATTTS